jgi:hypothetical protein
MAPFILAALSWERHSVETLSPLCCNPHPGNAPVHFHSFDTSVFLLFLALIACMAPKRKRQRSARGAWLTTRQAFSPASVRRQHTPGTFFAPH